MKVYEKMNELVNSDATKDQMKSWVYANRVCVGGLHLEEEFKSLETTVEKFIDEVNYHGMTDEHNAWDLFLEYEVVE